MTELDDTLTRLFAEARETPPAEDFLKDVLLRVHRARRRRAMKRAALIAVAAVLALVLTPCIVAGSLAWLPGLGNALTSPIAWVCALVLTVPRIRRHGRFR
ncbi:MAG TPA: hypothetical protein VFX20_01475 [Steroidobacteraceae bacterium]|nr:hypothetical protein [Steroidobacteraceae bacterium]